MRLLATLFLSVSLVAPLRAQKREIAELQRDVAGMNDQIRTLQRTVDEKMAQMQALLQQTIDATNKSNTSVAVLENTLRDRLRDQEKSLIAPVSNLGAKVDQMASEFQFVKESVNDLAARMTKLQAQIIDLGNAVKVIQSPPPPPGPAAGGATQSGPPAGVSAQQLYDNARRDMSGGNLDLALQQFQDFLRFFGSSDLAPNAQYYMGEIHYQKDDVANAIAAFDAVLERYPRNPRSDDALYMKGLALLKGGQKTAAAQEFRRLLEEEPRSDLASKARAQLKMLGYSPPAATPKKRAR